MPKDALSPDTLTVSIGQYSSAGAKPENQDFHGAVVPNGSALTLKGITLAVADGISSSAVSAEASETAIKSLLMDYYATPDAWAVQTAASKVIAATNAWLFGQNTAISDINAGRVCTLSALVLKGRAGHILHVGDSRISRVTAQALEPLTRDHRMILSAQEEYLGRALGVTQEVEIDYRRVPLQVGDLFLMTTDGVHEYIDTVVVQDVLKADDLDQAAKALALAALARGSDDNLTVQFARIEALPSGDGALDLDAAALPIPPLPKDGQVIDGFMIIRPLHATARSHVFLAMDSEGRKVALKIPASETAGDRSYLQRFVLEEWIARRVSSPHVLKAAQAPSERTCLYVVTEFVEGQTLRDWMTDNVRPTRDQVRGIVEQIAAGVRAFHRREMIHQDLRPENIMIDGNGTVKIIDLGSTTVAGVEEGAPGLLGEMAGTYQYTAPEYLSGDVVSWRSDQFALGVIAYEMLTGRLPYGAQVARIQSRSDQRRLSYATAQDDDSGVPEWMDAALRRALHPDPVRRYDGLSEFVADLKRPPSDWKPRRHVPLIERNPVRFWQTVSAVLAIMCLVLAT